MIYLSLDYVPYFNSFAINISTNEFEYIKLMKMHPLRFLVHLIIFFLIYLYQTTTKQSMSSLIANVTVGTHVLQSVAV